MPVFAYRASSAAGRVVRGREEAVSAPALERELSRRGLFPLEISAGEGAARRRGARLVSRRTEVADFVTTLAALLQAGLSLDRSLEVAGRGAAREDVAAAVSAARQHVREGGRLADALAQRPELFPAVAVGLIRAAEGGGHLAEAAGRLAGYLEREKALRSRIVSAMTYPILLSSAGAVAILILLLFVLPRFAALLQEAGSALPATTALLIALSHGLTRGFPFLVAGLIAAVIGLVAWRASPQGKERFHAILLRAPLFGGLRARHATARLAHTVSTLLAGGMPLVQALEIAEGSVGDAAVGADVREAREAVRRGVSFAAALGAGRAFPYAFLRLVEVGEETGELDGVLERAAALLEGELERRVERLVALLEPALIVVFGGVVGFVALALLQAVYGIHAQGM